MRKKLYFTTLALAAVALTAGAVEKDVVNYTFDDGVGFGGWGNSATFTVIDKSAIPGTGDEIIDATIDYSTVTSFTSWKQPENSTTVTWEIVDGCLKVTNTTASTDYWTLQYITLDNFTLVAGKTYTLKVVACGSSEATIRGNVGSWSDNATFSFPVTTEMTEQTCQFTAATSDVSHVILQHADFVGTLQVKSVSICHNAEPEGETTIAEGDKVLAISNPSAVEFYGVQACIDLKDKGIENGATYYLTFDARGSVPATGLSIGLQHSADFSSRGDFNQYSVSTGWSPVAVQVTCTGDETDRLLFNVGAYVGTLYLDNVRLYYIDDTDAIDEIAADSNAPVEVYDLMGRQVKTSVGRANAVEGLAPGLYIVGGKKLLVR